MYTSSQDRLAGSICEAVTNQRAPQPICAGLVLTFRQNSVGIGASQYVSLAVSRHVLHSVVRHNRIRIRSKSLVSRPNCASDLELNKVHQSLIAQRDQAQCLSYDVYSSYPSSGKSSYVIITTSRRVITLALFFSRATCSRNSVAHSKTGL